MKLLIVMEFNEEYLGPKWMNQDNLNLLLYTEAKTKPELLKVTSFEEWSTGSKESLFDGEYHMEHIDAETVRLTRLK